MAEIHGNQGSIFYRSGYISASTITFADTDPDTILDSADGFVAAGFVAGDTIAVTGTDSNNDEFTIDTGGVAIGTLTLIGADTVVAEPEGAAVIQTVPGTELGGFFNWSISWDAEVHDVTDFANGSARVFQAGNKPWTATAEKFWLTGGASADTEPQPGDTHYLRFFVVYTASPDVTTNYYYEGSAICSAYSPATPADGIVQGTISWQGTGALVWTTRNTAWG